jgi:hypothetical protein
MIRTIAAAGTICGILDGLSAIALFGWYGSTPAEVFQGIASGALGCAAVTGGAGAVVVGVAAHFAVAFGAAAAYYAISRMRPGINDHPILAGMVFGAAVHLFMTFVVIPLSAIGPRPIVWSMFLWLLAVHLIVVGLSISITESRLA